MNILSTVKEAASYIAILTTALFFVSFLETASANHASYGGVCTPPITSSDQSQECRDSILNYCSELVLQGSGTDVDTCVSGYTYDIAVTAPTQPAAPTSEGGTKGLNNPLAVTSLQDLFEAVMTAFIILCVPFIVFFVILAGFQYVTARGNPEKIKAASQALMYAVIGAVIIVGAIAITSIVGGTVNEFKTN